MSSFRFKAIRALTFGRFNDASIDDLDHPFVVIHGGNETGKSTITEFLTWITGGPVGTAVDSQRFGEYRQKLKGRLLADLNGVAVDIEGTFEIKNRDAPNDSRRGTIGATDVNAETIGAHLGRLQAVDYAFIYRLIGPVLHDTESSAKFGDVLTQFAIGSAVSEINPATVARELSDKAKSHKSHADGLKKEIKRVEDLIREQQKSPARLADIEKELLEIEERIKNIDESDLGRTREIEIHKFAIAAFEANARMRKLRDELDSRPAPAESWTEAVKNAGDIRREIHDAKELLGSIRRVGSEADSLATQVGLTVEDAGTRTISLSDKSRMQTAGDSLRDATNGLETARTDFDQGAQRCREAMEKVSQAAASLGISSDEVFRLSTVIGTWTELNNAAVTWGNNAGRAGHLQDDAEKAQESAGAARANLAIEERYSTSGPTSSDGRTPIVIAAVAVAAFLAGAIWRPALIVGAVLVAGVLGQWWLAARRSSRSISPIETVSEGRIRVRDLESQAIESQRKSADARIDAETAREAFAGRLAPFGVAVPPVELAQDVCARIKEASEVAVALREEESRQRARQAAVDAAQTAVSDARGEFDRIAESCGVVYPGDLAGLSAWLDTYALAVTRCRELREFTVKFQARQQAIRTLFGAAVPSGADPLADRLMQELDEQVRITRDYEDITSKLGGAEREARAAAGNNEDVESLLRSVATVAELEGMVDLMSDERARDKADRDQLIEQRRTLNTEKRAIENTEFINALSLEKSELEERFEEKTSEYEAFSIAAKTLADVINDFQTKNQAPMVKRANEILDAVVSGYGDLVYSTDDSGKPVIERVCDRERLRTSKLSTGSRALAYLALRLAFVEADHAKRGVALPILCDDPLVHVDDERAPEVIKILAQASKSHQVVLFTCHDDTRDLAVKAGARLVSL